MNAFALSGLGVTVTPDQINTITNIASQTTPTGSKASVIASGAAAGAGFGTAVPVIGTAVGAVLGAFAALIKLGNKPATHTMKRVTINGLEYMELIPKDPANRFHLLVLIDGHASTFVPILPLSTTNSLLISGTLKREYEAQIQAKLADFFFSKGILQVAEKNPNDLLTYKFPADIVKSVQAKGYDFNKVDRLVLTAPDGVVYSIRGNQVFSNMQAPGKPGEESPAIMQAGFGWIGALVALSIIGGLWWSAHKAEKKKKNQST
ncbi:MAG: hypothetical protein QY309_04865 [Cyclobacteriaceae bacterium]|nr:MAG: hypothetical protein QY309_04865 [Cyclobacteriaceae bacterium]